MKKVFWAAGLLGLLVCLYVMTGAQSTVTGTLYVQGEVPDEVWVAPQSIFFPTLHHSNWMSGSSVISVRAPIDVPYYMTIDAGQNCSGMTPRAMKHAAEESFVQYYIFQDSLNTLQWGDNGYGNTYTGGEPMGPLTGTGVQQDISVYAQAMCYGTAVPGTYSDTVIVTVHY